MYHLKRLPNNTNTIFLSNVKIVTASLIIKCMICTKSKLCRQRGLFMKLKNRKLSRYRVGQNSFDYSLNSKIGRRIVRRKLLQRGLGILVLIGLPSSVFFISSAYASQQNKATLDSSSPVVSPSYDAPSSSVTSTTSQSTSPPSGAAGNGLSDTTSVSSSDNISADTTPSSTSVTLNKQTVQNQGSTTTTTNANVNGQPVTVPVNGSVQVNNGSTSVNISNQTSHSGSTDQSSVQTNLVLLDSTSSNNSTSPP